MSPRLRGGSPLRTPARVAHRGFQGSPPIRRDVDVGLTQEEEEEFIVADDGNFLYGTNINEAQIVKDFHRFVTGFRLSDAQIDSRSYYLQELDRIWEEQLYRTKGIMFPICGVHIFDFSQRLYGHLVNFPTEVIPIFDRELWRISVRELRTDPEDLGTCQAKIHDLHPRDHRIMRSIDPCDIEHLVSLKGIVIRVSDLVPDMQSALFRCTVEDCKQEMQVPLSHWAIDEPTKCEGCGGNHTFQIVHNDSTFTDRQLLKLQETPELVPEGETPQNVCICCFDDLVDQVRPGDRIEVTGIYRATAVRPMQNWRTCSSVYRTYIDGIAIAAGEKDRVDAAKEEVDLLPNGKRPTLADKGDLDPETNSEEEIRMNLRIRELGAERGEDGKQTIVGNLVKSFAPSIFEEDDVKRGLLCQLFGGTKQAPSAAAKGRTRPEINTLLCGDPSTAKSQLMQYAYKLAPRGVFTSGKGTSAVGLTASINRDPVTKDLVLESGALVLADRGLCCIDEFDKMDDNARAILHEAMEQQTVSVAKAGIVCSLNARTSILASANPKESSYDPKRSVVDNINLPKNLMSRFDFIWLMLDKRNRDTDRRLGEHLVSMYSVSGVKKKVETPLDANMFRRYISFAKRWVHPVITDDAAAALVKAYTDLRNQGSSREVITATARHLESLIRISESVTKMELREEVTPADVDEAMHLLKVATYAAAIDPETGLIDMEQLIAGVGAGRRKRAKEIESLLQEVLASKEGAGTILIESLRALMNEKLGEKKEQLLEDHEFNLSVKAAEDDGIIIRRGKMVELR